MKNIKIVFLLLWLLSSISVQGQYCNDANDLFKQGKYSEAIKKYNSCLEYEDVDQTTILSQIQNANNCITLQKEGENYIAQKKWKTAFEYFNKIVGINPNDTKAKNTLNLCIEKGDIPNVRVETIYKTDTIVKTEKEIVFVRDTTFIVMRDTTTIVQPTPINTTFNFLPLGVHQYANKRYGKGVLFTVTQIGLPVLGGFLVCKTKDTYNTLQNEPYQSAKRHNSLKNGYRWQLVGTIACFTGMAAMIVWNYCDNFKTFGRNQKTILIPTAILDERGKLQMGISLNIKI